MTNIIMMIMAFLIVTGIALLYMSVLQMNMGEGMICSAASMMVLLFLSAFIANTFRYGMLGIYLLSGIGAVCFVIRWIRKKNGQLLFTGIVVWGILACLFVVCLVIYHNDFIQHTDEFHLWAALVKYMKEKDRLPIGNDFIAGPGQIYLSSSLFIAFFQIFAGYNEGNMYVASTLLTFIGLLLPLSGYKKKEWKKVVFYVAMMYVAIFSLYLYATKTLYVDMMTVAWAGGLAGWWLNRDKNKKNLIIIPTVIAALVFMKPSSGLLMAVYVTLFIIGHHMLIEKRLIQKSGAVKKINLITGILCALVLAGSVGIIGLIGQIHTQKQQIVENGQETVKTAYMIGDKELPESISQRVELYSISMNKVKKTMGTFITYAFGNPLGSRSSLKLAFVPFMILLLILLSLFGELNQRQREVAFYRNYLIFMSLSYCAVLFFSFITMFGYELSVTVRGMSRYLAVCAVFWFIIVLVLFFQNNIVHRVKLQKYLMCALFLVFLSGLNNKYIPNTTALDKQNVIGYEDIMSAKEQSEAVKSVLQENDRVYFIYQIAANQEPGDADLITSPVMYYLDIQISNYGVEPWRFYEGGCNIAIEDVDTMGIQNLPDLLTAGGYTYLWIYRSNNYLRDELPNVLNNDGDSVEAGLYKVVYEDGRVAGIQYLQALQ